MSEFQELGNVSLTTPHSLEQSLLLAAVHITVELVVDEVMADL